MFGVNTRTYSEKDRRIAKRRINEDRLASLTKVVKNNLQLSNFAQFEASSNKISQIRCFKEQKIEEKQKYENDLNIRRAKLRKLLKNEEIYFKNEIDNQMETPQQRRARLENKAKMLKEKRLKYRDNYCKMQKLKQFRQECDELRMNNGKNLIMECDRIRKQQIYEKEMEKMYEKNAEKKWLNNWNNNIINENKKLENKLKNKQKILMDTANELKEQIDYNEKINEEKKQERILENLNKKKLYEMNKKKELIEKENELKKKHEMQRIQQIEYENYQKLKEEKLNNEKIENKKYIDQLILQENENINNELKQKDNLAKDINEYLSYLNELKKENKNKEIELEKMRQKELEKTWNKRENEWKKERKAKELLLKNVIRERDDQIAYKKKLEEYCNKENNKDYGKSLILDNNINETKKKENKLKYNLEIQEYLKKQISEKNENEKKLRNELLSNENMLNEQKIYNKLLKDEMQKDENMLQQGISQHNYPRKSANWYSY